MKRVFITLSAAVGLLLGMAVPVNGLIGSTRISLSCDDGTTLDTVVDTATLNALQASLQALVAYPAGLSCTLTQSPVVQVGNVATAWAADGFVNGGGRFPGDCGNGSTFWINFAVNAHNRDGGVVGTVNLAVPEGQCAAPGQFKSTPTCLQIFTENPTLAWVTSQIKETSGTYFGQFGVTPGTYHRFSFEDNGTPGQQTAFDRLGLNPVGSDPACAGPSVGPWPWINVLEGNVTIHFNQ